MTMQVGPARDLLTAAELESLTLGEMTSLMAGKVTETATLFCAAARKAGYGEHSGDVATCRTPRCAETRAIVNEYARRARDRRII